MLNFACGFFRATRTSWIHDNPGRNPPSRSAMLLCSAFPHFRTVLC
ncbi:hypothetical protein BVRB_8g181720 [Beta vulgaris subsp. vulgaris]|nr:hypothetical protein BVRB_8g181720 [Beta vulgaris subsp. vulgaris]